MKKLNILSKTLTFLLFFLFSNLLFAQTNTSPTQTVCAGSLSEPYLMNPTNAGSNYQWTLSGGGTLNSGTTSDNITVDWGVIPGVYTVSVTETDSNGCQGAPVTVDVTVISLPNSTTATSQTACLGLLIPDLSAIGSSVTWYDDLALTNQVGVGNNFATGQTSVGLYTYYVTESLNDCEGPSIPVTLEIYSIPSAPLTVNKTSCFNSLVPDLTASGTNLTWYSDINLNIVVGNGTTFSTGESISGLYTYYVTQTDVNGCESLGASVTLEIYTLPSSPSSNNESACFGATIPPLSTIGTLAAIWYDDPGLTNIVGSGNSYLTGQTVVGVYTYYLTDTDANGCESAATIVTLEIYALANAPVSINEVACEGGLIPDLSATGSNLTWYSDAVLTTVVANGSNFSTGETLDGVYTYYVTETNINNCESSATVVTLTINSFSTVPFASNQTACFGATVPDLTVTGIGTSFTWYSDVALMSVVGNSTPFQTGQTAVGTYTYYVTESQNGCESPAISLSLIIYATPTTGPIIHW